MRRTVEALVVCALTMVGINAYANVVGNPGFEVLSGGIVPSWDGHVGSCSGGPANVELWNSSQGIVAHGGNQHLEISSSVANEAVCQEVTYLAEGCPTTFCFWYAGRPDAAGGGSYDNRFNFELSGSYTYTLAQPLEPDPYDPPTADWLQYCTAPFLPGPGSLTIAFTRNPSPSDIGGAHIDDVDVTQDQACAPTTPTPTLTPTPTPSPTATADHFLCYRPDRFLPDSGTVLPSSVQLVDQFGNGVWAPTRATSLCLPTNKLNEDPTAPTHPDHLRMYALNLLYDVIANVTIPIADQFHPNGFLVNPKKGSTLLVPTAKSLSATPPLPAAFLTDHYKCHRARFFPGNFLMLNVTLQDQFGSMTVKVRRPKVFCAPVNKNNEDPSAPFHNRYLVCYDIRPNVLPGPPPIAYLNNQFGPEIFTALDVYPKFQLCVPAADHP